MGCPFEGYSQPIPDIQDETAYKLFLRKRYGFPKNRIRFTDRFAMVIQGAHEELENPPVSCTEKTPLYGRFHTVVVGGGPAGLTASVYLTDRVRRVLLLEKEPELGGAALGATGNASYGRGGAYVTDVEKNLLRIYKHLGLGDFLKNQSIPEPIDSYWWNHDYYVGVWDHQSLERLPKSFSIFKFLLEKMNDENGIPSQPMETHPAAAQLDQINFAQWVRQMPSELERRAFSGDLKALELLKTFEQSSEAKLSEPMRPVLKLLELYGRSALGDHPEEISAAAFANFYISEIGPRFSSSLGSGFVSQAAIKKLKRRPWFHSKTNSRVKRMVVLPQGVRVCFQRGSEILRVEARHAVYAIPLGFAPSLIEELDSLDPEKLKTIQQIGYRHYQVMNFHLQGHPWHDSYGLWIRDDATYSTHGVTDLIEGRWFDFEGNKKPRLDDRGVLTLYNPLPEQYLSVGLTEKVVIERAETAAIQLEELVNQLLQKRNEPPLKILAIEINRWPYSIHVVKPGHLTQASPVLSRRIGDLFFASNNLGTPAVEEALYRGFLAAKNILAREDSKSEDGKDPNLD